MKANKIVVAYIIWSLLASFLNVAKWIDYYYYPLLLKFPLACYIGLKMWRLPRKKSISKRKYLGQFTIWAIIFSLLYLSSVFFGGILNGFSKNPYNISIKGIGYNIATVIFPQAMLLWTTSYFILHQKKNRRILWTVGMSIAIGLSTITLGRFMNVQSIEIGVKLIAGEVIPAIVLNGLILYFSIIASPFIGMMYYTIVTLPFYVLNVVPNLNWLSSFFVKTTLLFFGLLILHETYSTKARLVKKRNQSKDSVFGLMMISIFSVLAVWFTVGVFPLFPSVVVTGSMYPYIQAGDIVVIEKVIPSEVEVGDVLYFESKNIHIVHRVIDQNEEGQFQTKGDNNMSSDLDWVSQDAVKGIVKFKVPWVGKIILWMRR
ncbi:MAG: signal peptidase I [Vallitaleaceae bacterium]|nr:signal peptidase I [Vallitaleaceae bacterium]